MVLTTIGNQAALRARMDARRHHAGSDACHDDRGSEVRIYKLPYESERCVVIGETYKKASLCRVYIVLPRDSYPIYNVCWKNGDKIDASSFAKWDALERVQRGEGVLSVARLEYGCIKTEIGIIVL